MVAGRSIKKTPFYKKEKFRTGLFIFSLVIIPLIQFAIFWVYVSFDTIALTFQRYNIRTGGYEWFGIERYKQVISEYILGTDGHPASHRIFLNSFHGLAVAAVQLPIVYICAYVFYKQVPMQKFFRFCFYLPGIISVSVLTLSFRNMFHPEFGPIKMLFDKLGYNRLWLDSESEQMWPLIYLYSILTASTGVITLNGAMNRIPEDIREYGKLEGIGFWREAFQIVLPLVMPTVGVSLIGIPTAIFGFCPMLIAVDPGVGNKFYTVSWMIIDATKSGSQNAMMLASTLGIAMTVMVTPFVILVSFLVNKFTPDVDF